jgi:hypothetical protein
LYAALPFLLLRRWRPASVFVLAWVAANAWLLRRLPGSTRRKAASLPVVLAGDAVTAMSLLVGSSRSRTLVL